jgi:hypothetical protein
VQGRLDAALDANYEKAEKAVNLAITQMEFAKVSEKKDVLNAILIARTAEDEKIEIKVSRGGAPLPESRFGWAFLETRFSRWPSSTRSSPTWNSREDPVSPRRATRRMPR